MESAEGRCSGVKGKTASVIFLRMLLLFIEQ